MTHIPSASRPLLTAHRAGAEISARAAAQADRAAGVLLGHAAGDALGVPYEFATLAADQPHTPQMLGGGLGNYRPGEWSDDTQMSMCVARAAARARLDDQDPLVGPNLDEVAGAFVAWQQWGPPDIGNQTSAVLAAAARFEAERDRARTGTAQSVTEAARAHAQRTGHAAGNGAVMRTESIALAFLHDRHAAAAAAARVARLTHHDPLAVASCVLVVDAIRRAVLTGVLDVHAGLDLLDTADRDAWTHHLDVAVEERPDRFTPNGFTVTAVQAAVSAIVHTPVPAQTPAAHLVDALGTAIRIGDDTDTVAAIAGGMLGAVWGASAVPWRLRRLIHGWAGAPASTSGVPLRERDLISLATDLTDGPEARNAVTRRQTVPYGEPRSVAVPHPYDAGVLLGTSNCEAPGADAVVSLCRVGTNEPAFAHMAPADRVEVRLIDSDAAGDNANLEFVLADAAVAVAQLRSEGRTVLLHCVAAQQRTPSVAVAYARLLGHDPDVVAAAVSSALHRSVRGHGHVWDTARSPELGASLDRLDREAGRPRPT